jgi:hypothetical protein
MGPKMPAGLTAASSSPPPSAAMKSPSGALGDGLPSDVGAHLARVGPARLLEWRRPRRMAVIDGATRGGEHHPLVSVSR